MKESEARKLLERILPAIQKAKSNSLEAVGDDKIGKDVVQDIAHFDSPIMVIGKILGDEKSISGHDFYNVVTLFNFIPFAMRRVILSISDIENWPEEPNIEWITNWDSET